MRLLLINIIFLAFSATSYSQTHHIGGVFPTIDLKYKFDPAFEIESYSFLSYFPSAKTLDSINYPAHAGALYTELDFTYNVNSNLGLTASYTYERANPFESSYRNENRVWLQATLKSKVNKLEIKNRLRYDFRLIQNRTTGKVDYLPRLRYLLGLAYPLQKKENPIVLNVYSEMFFNTFKDSSPFYNENWAFAGVKFPFSERWALELGYLNISWVRNNQNNWLSQHFGQMTLIYTIK